MQSFPHSLSDSSIVETDIPARLDRLPWGRFHTRVVVALGITWILDGLEVTLAGALSGALKESPVLEFTNADVGIASIAGSATSTRTDCNPSARAAASTAA